jgi:hypothetical protein
VKFARDWPSLSPFVHGVSVVNWWSASHQLILTKSKDLLIKSPDDHQVSQWHTRKPDHLGAIEFVLPIGFDANRHQRSVPPLVDVMPATDCALILATRNRWMVG